jgi:hypothetical protein
VLRDNDVCHGSIEQNSMRTPSILRVYRLERTTPHSRCDTIRGRYYDFFVDQGETTSFEYLSVPCHMADNFSACQKVQYYT